ncbi:hypothetical protein TRVA0_017S02432 [Trichomonascus vanleenenianus]|uniref:Sdd3p n=1 Tax=Trichomonascus vanleenenianus TaxID=2268995 RepID=UPI003ECAA7CD
MTVKGASNFKLQADIKTTYGPTRIYNWRSTRTNLQLVLIRKETPVVNGYFAVASEIEDDSGCPHTLEHLVFMGSKKYPYKGLLDMVGNRMLSNTNAWTDTDQTVYTLTTAGWEGFRTLLPVYLDHLLNPTLTDSACLTEVYHIDGQGEEKGVVFSEMQGVENTSDSLLALRSRQLLYQKQSGYSSETGGLMDSLRVLTNDQIREFHKLRYKPNNLCVIITGDVEPEEFIQVMDEFDNSIELPENPTAGKRPFVDSPQDPKLPDSKIETIEFPETDESFGEAQIAWVGPDTNDLIINTAIDVFGAYLTRLGIGKLSLELVDVADPLSTSIYYYTNDFINTSMNFLFSGVPTERLDTVDVEVMRILNDQLEKFDLDFVRDCVERSKQKFLSSNEKDPQTLAYMAISNFLYGSPDGKHLIECARDVSDFEAVAQWTREQWIDMIKTYFIDNPRVTVLGKPSEKLYDRLVKEKEGRLAGYREKYGEEGLKKLADRLEKAQEENNHPVPEEITKQFKSPDPSKIRFIKTSTARAGRALKVPECENDVQKLVSRDEPKDFPLFIQFDSFDSQFVNIQVMLSSRLIKEEQLPYVDVIIRELFSLPMVLPDGTKLTYEEVVRQVKRDTVSNLIGPASQFEEFISIIVLAKWENYEKAIEWIQRAMFNSVFDKDRLQVIIEKHLNSLPEFKRDGSNVLHSSIVRSNFSPRSLKRAQDAIETEELYEDLADMLESGNDKEFEKFVKKLEELRKSLFTPENMRIAIQGDMTKLSNPVSAWKPLADLADGSRPLEAIPKSVDVRTEHGMKLCGDAYITPMPATESSFLSLVTQGPSDYRDKEIPALALACEYLQAVEGPLWRGIRGTGLAYGAWLTRNVDAGQVSFDVYRGADSAKAIEVARKLVEDLAAGTVKFDPTAVEGAKSSIANNLANQELNGSSAGLMNFFNMVIKQVGSNFTQKFMKQLSEVSIEELQAVMKKYLMPLFDKKSSSIYVACHPSMVENLEQTFKSLGYDVNINPLVEDEEEDSDQENSDEEEGSEESEADGEN